MKSDLNPLFIEFHQSLISSLINDTKKFPASLLLTGDVGVGKHTLAKHLASLLLGDTYSINCTEITPEEEGSSHTIKIEQLRELKETQGFGGFGSDYRVILIPEAHQMTLQAANGLLKILEEPPSDWVFILTSSYPSLLPITILSRCQKLPVRPLTDEKLKKILETERLEILKQDDLSGGKALQFAQGSIGKALQYLDPASDAMKSLADRFIKAPAKELNTVIDKISLEPQDLQFWLDLTEVELHSRLKHQQKMHSAALTKTLASFESLARLREGQSLPLNKKLLLQEYLFSWV